MARQARRHQLQKSLIYHVINRGNARSNIFHDEEDFSHFRGVLKKYKKEYGFLLYHWVLMNNHFHLVVELEEPEKLSVAMAGMLRMALSIVWANSA